MVSSAKASSLIRSPTLRPLGHFTSSSWSVKSLLAVNTNRRLTKWVAARCCISGLWAKGLDRGDGSTNSRQDSCTVEGGVMSWESMWGPHSQWQSWWYRISWAQVSCAKDAANWKRYLSSAGSCWKIIRKKDAVFKSWRLPKESMAKHWKKIQKK